MIFHTKYQKKVCFKCTPPNLKSWIRPWIYTTIVIMHIHCIVKLALDHVRFLASCSISPCPIPFSLSVCHRHYNLIKIRCSLYLFFFFSDTITYNKISFGTMSEFVSHTKKYNKHPILIGLSWLVRHTLIIVSSSKMAVITKNRNFFKLPKLLFFKIEWTQF